MKKQLYLLILFPLLTACDCFQVVRGVVVDNRTGLPVQGAKVFKKMKEQDCALTDSTGNFELRSISGGLFGCPSVKVIVLKDGYEKRQVKISGHKEIRLKEVK